MITSLLKDIDRIRYQIFDYFGIKEYFNQIGDSTCYFWKVVDGCVEYDLENREDEDFMFSESIIKHFPGKDYTAFLLNFQCGDGNWLCIFDNSKEIKS